MEPRSDAEHALLSSGRIMAALSPQTGAVHLLPRSLLALILGLVLLPLFASAQGPSEVSVSIDRWGAGGAIRRGEMAALRMVITDLGTRQRELLVRLEFRDSDGDSPQYQAVLAGNPGIEQRVWMYARVPAWARGGDPLTVVVYEAEEDPAAPAEVDPAGRGVRPGRVVARVPVAMPARIAEPYEAFIGVVGRQPSPSLSLYGTTASGGGIGEEWAPMAHERVSQVMLTPGEIPDRWFGLLTMGWMVWIDGSPADMSPDAAAALREWVSRGGHLVIVLPTAGQSWVSREGSGFAELLPRARITRREGVAMEPYRPMLTDSATIQLPTSTVLHEFTPLADASIAEAIRVLSGPDGECVVARRLVGTGAVTVIGLDVNHVALRGAGLPQPERFWHRILGMRGLRPSSAELQRLVDVGGASVRQRSPVWVDEDIPTIVARRGRATAGVLLGFMVFVSYWIVAGPLGFALMKRYGVQQHAWLGFFGVGAVFTGIAWGGATFLRPREVSATHLTLVDHVYGQPVQRARSWMSVLLPEYGRSLVSVTEPSVGNLPGQSRNIIVPWEARSVDTGLSFTFPDSSSYAVESRQPSQMAVPSRATIKQFQAEWSGGPKWGMPRPVAPEGVAPESARLSPSFIQGAAGARGRDIVVGTLVHELPAPLENVVVIYAAGQEALVQPGGTTPGQFMVGNAYAFRLTSPWAPGQPLDLERVTSEGATISVGASEFIRDLLKNQVSAAGYRMAPEAIWDRQVAQALFPMLAPPEFTTGITTQTQELARRGATHGWDLGLWFTQPCVIILGQMGPTTRDAPTPVPLSVDGRAIAAQGRTVVRWVYPLPDRPPRQPASITERDRD
ncbi:MAG: hypothetical protein KF705_07100 [Phycisphaeraceae bacterium]|nr:hypothetical protein [Phycisphaeraceae bacterium]